MTPDERESLRLRIVNGQRRIDEAKQKGFDTYSSEKRLKALRDEYEREMDMVFQPKEQRAA